MGGSDPMHQAQQKEVQPQPEKKRFGGGTTSTVTPTSSFFSGANTGRRATFLGVGG